MIPYYVLVASPFVAVLLQNLFKNKYNIKSDKNNVAIPVFFTIYFLLVALRNLNVGSDTYNYAHWFSVVGEMSWIQVFKNFFNSDIGYYVLNKLVSVVTDEVQILFMIVAFISIYPLGKLYYKESQNSLLSIALFLIFPVFIMNFTGLRQGIAIGLGVYAYYAAKEKNLKKFIFTVISASLFHNSALILFLLYPFYNMKFSKKHILLLAPIITFVYLFNERIYLVLLPIFGERYEERYGEIGETGAYSILILFILFTIYAFVVPNESLMDETTKGLRNIMILSLTLQMFVPVNTIAMRMNYYFIIFVPLLIPRITSRWIKARKEYRWLINIAMCVYFIAHYLDKAHSVDSLNIYPYMFFWE